MGTISASIVLAKLPGLYLTFWFFELPVKLFKTLFKFLLGLEHLLSLSLMIQTFFQPWKNERRKGYYAYAVGIGVAVRLLLIFLDLLLLLSVFILGAALILIFVCLPLIGVLLLFLGLTGYEFSI